MEKNILVDRAVLQIFGLDSMNLLNNLLTNDIKNLDYSYNYCLNKEGRYLYDLFVFKKTTSNFIIDIHIKQVESFKNHIFKYALNSDVQILDLSNEYSVIYSKLPIYDNSIISILDPRYSKLSYRSIISSDKTKSPVFLKEDLYLRDKYDFVIVDGFYDLLFQKSIPIEYGCEEFNSISFKKGCYLGQEVMSRLKSLGVVRKRLFKVESSFDISRFSIGTDIISDNKKYGILCSTYKKQGIAILKIEDSLLKSINFSILDIPIILSIPEWRKNQRE